MKEMILCGFDVRSHRFTLGTGKCLWLYFSNWKPHICGIISIDSSSSWLTIHDHQSVLPLELQVEQET